MTKKTYEEPVDVTEGTDEAGHAAAWGGGGLVTILLIVVLLIIIF